MCAPINLLQELSSPILLHLFDGSLTHAGVITHSLSVDVSVEGTNYKCVNFYMTPLHPLAKLVLGLFWLRQENPVIDWTSLTLTQQTPATVGHNPTETYASIPELHTCAPIEAIDVISHSPATQDVVPGLSPTAVYVPGVVDINAMTNLRLAAVHYKLPMPRPLQSSTLDWPPSLEDTPYFDNDLDSVSDITLDDTDPLDFLDEDAEASPKDAPPPEVKVISVDACYWGSLAISDLDSINIDLMSSTAVPPAPKHLVAMCKPTPLTTKEHDLMEHMVPSQYHDYMDVFSAAEADVLTPHRPYNHTINLEEGTTPPFGPIYLMSETELKALKTYIDNMFNKGFICNSNSPAGAPVLFAKKKDGSLHLCVDY